MKRIRGRSPSTLQSNAFYFSTAASTGGHNHSTVSTTGEVFQSEAPPDTTELPESKRQKFYFGKMMATFVVNDGCRATLPDETDTADNFVRYLAYPVPLVQKIDEGIDFMFRLINPFEGGKTIK